MALNFIIGGLQLLSAAVNVLALGAFWISPGLRATANRFVINLLVANIIACLALTPALVLNGGLKTRFHMDNGDVASTVETIYQSSPNLQFETDIRHTDAMHEIDGTVSTVNSLHHPHHHEQQQAYSYHRANRYERDVEQQPDFIIDSVQSTSIRNNQIEKSSIESLIVNIQSGNDGKDDEIEIMDEIESEPASMGNGRTLDAESIPTIKQRSSTAHHRAHNVFSENALIFDCTRFYGYDFAAAVGKQSILLLLLFFIIYTLCFFMQKKKIKSK